MLYCFQNYNLKMTDFVVYESDHLLRIKELDDIVDYLSASNVLF